MGKKRSYKRKARGHPWDDERLLAVIDFFSAIPGGEIQIRTEQLSESTGIPVSSLKRNVTWAVRYGAIEKVPQYAFGQGRLPTLYRVLIPIDQWVDNEETGHRGVGRLKQMEWEASAKEVEVSIARKKAPPPAPVGYSGGWLDVR